jgi:hypothetical protein
MKISGAFRTVKSARDFAAMRSVAATARKQGWNILRTLTACPHALSLSLAKYPNLGCDNKMTCVSSCVQNVSTRVSHFCPALRGRRPDNKKHIAHISVSRKPMPQNFRGRRIARQAPTIPSIRLSRPRSEVPRQKVPNHCARDNRSAIPVTTPASRRQRWAEVRCLGKHDRRRRGGACRFGAAGAWGDRATRRGRADRVEAGRRARRS